MDLSYSWAVIMGLVEGLTEFIPVSSTGHLVLASEMLGVRGPIAHTFEIVIQLGAILAVVVLYWERFLDLFDFAAAARANRGGGQGLKGATGIAKLLTVCVPAFLIGPIIGDFVKATLFNPLPIAIAMITGAILILLVDRGERKIAQSSLDDVTFLQCLGIGLFQCLALWPGMSRSASTIVGGIVLGLSRRTAAEFSFIAAVPVMCAATLFDLLKNYRSFTPDVSGYFLVGLVVAFLSGLAAIKIFINVLQRYTLKPFAIYRIIVGMAVLFVLYF